MNLIHQIALLLAISICFLNLANAALPDGNCLKCDANYKYYCFHSEILTFDQALAACDALGARLSTIRSAEENECFRKAIAPFGPRAWWTSGNNRRSPAGPYVWESIHEPVEQEFWALLQRPHPEPNCIAVYPIQEYNNWFKEACTNRFSYVCERPL